MQTELQIIMSQNHFIRRKVPIALNSFDSWALMNWSRSYASISPKGKSWRSPRWSD
jgi:hypothetical protein